MSISDPAMLVRDLEGQPCCAAQNPYGSILLLDFGAMKTSVDASSSGGSRGWRSLSVLSPWRLETENHVLCDWNVTGGANGYIDAQISVLVGESVLEVETRPPGWDLRIKWSNGLVLLVFGDCTDLRGEAWYLLGDEGQEVAGVLVVAELRD